MEWIHLAYDTDQQRSTMNMEMNLWIPQNAVHLAIKLQACLDLKKKSDWRVCGLFWLRIEISCDIL
jgi:hypothetical protein